MHRLVADVTSWSMRWALLGKFPSTGPFGEPLTGMRADVAGHVLAGEYHFAYFGFKADAKARKESHRFCRTYQCSQICEVCLAERPNIYGDPALCFKNFFDGAYLLTELSHEEYLQSSDQESPWESMIGFHVKSVFRDPMHTIFLGTGKELIASCLGYWCRKGYIEGATLTDQLRGISEKQKGYCKRSGLRANFKTLTPANTNLEKKSEYPELGSSFKACTVKVMIWFSAVFSAEIARSYPKDRGPKNQQFF